MRGLRLLISCTLLAGSGLMAACGGRSGLADAGVGGEPRVRTEEAGVGQPGPDAAASGGAAIIRCPAGRLVSVSGPACGNGQLDPGELCDDGNALSEDGCNSRCRVEMGWSCPSPGAACIPCGNCKIDPGEQCDDGNTRGGDGCSADCKQEPGFRCSTFSSEPGCLWAGLCGDGKLGPFGEVCDDGNTRGGDGCSANCKTIEPGFTCPTAGTPCELVTASRPHCGNGIVEAQYGETCDDGINDSRRGGCTAVCTIPRCGDGLVQLAYGEDCDDGVNQGAYGSCMPDCSMPPPPASPDCSLFTPFCGDGIVQPTAGELCDDGINNGLVGCEPGCRSHREGLCGDGILQEAYEECDDGNTASCDGCSSFCQVERAVSP